MCERCLLKNRIRWHDGHVFKVKPDGICRMCDQPALPGKKVCAVHLDVLRRNLVKANEARRQKKQDGGYVGRFEFTATKQGRTHTQVR